MALELVTGYWGTEHVTAEQDADLQAGIIGKGCFVLPIGERMKAEAVTANKIRLFDGVFVGYGRQAYIEEGAYEDVTIENGTAGLLRNDMIIVKYKKDEVTGVEGVTFGVLKGQTGTKPTDPVPNNQDIRSGTFESEMPLYRVRLNGLAIEAIEKLYEIPKTNKELTDAVSQLNAELEKKNDAHLLLATSASANIIFSAEATRFPIVIYGTAAGSTAFAFMVPFNNPTGALAPVTKSYLLKGVDAIDLLYVYLVAENGKYRLRFTNSTGIDVALYITLGSTTVCVTP